MTMLVSRNTGTIVADFSRVCPEEQFRSKALTQSLAFRGIQIPKNLQTAYEKREVIYLGDKLFPIAFKEIYAPQHFPYPSYYWTDKTCVKLNSLPSSNMQEGF